MALIDYLMVAALFAVILLVGARFRKWVGDPDDFYVAGRLLPPAILAATLAATNINLYNFVGYAGKAYEYGISIIWHEWTGLMCLVFSGLLVLPMLRRLRTRTLPEFLEIRFSRHVRILVAAIWFLRIAFTLGIILYLCGVVAQQVTGTEGKVVLGASAYTWWLVVFAAVGIITTTLGGAWSVVLTDVLQFVFLLGGFLILFPIVMHEVGGVGALLEALPAERFDFVPKEGPFNWSFIIAIWLLGIQWACTDQTMIQRGLGGHGARSVARGMVLSGVIMIPFALLIVLPGMAAAVLEPGLKNPDAAVPALVGSLPAVVLGFVLCGFLSSQLSTVDSWINSGATLFTNDIFRFMGRRDPSPKTILRVARGTTVMLGIFGVGVGCWVIPLYRGAVEAYLDLIGILDMPLFVVAILCGLLWKRANWKGAFTGYIGGAAAAFLMSHVLIERVMTPGAVWEVPGISGLAVSGFMVANKLFFVTLTGMVVSLVLCIAVSLATAPPDPSGIRAVWGSRESGADEAAEGEAFNIVPRSLPGRLFLGLFFLGLLVFLCGTFLGAWGMSCAAPLALSGMMLYFAAGLARLYCD